MASNVGTVCVTVVAIERDDMAKLIEAYAQAQELSHEPIGQENFALVCKLAKQINLDIYDTDFVIRASQEEWFGKSRGDSCQDD